MTMMNVDFLKSNGDVEAGFSSYEHAAFVEYELREGKGELNQDQLEEVADVFFELDDFNGLFALMYDGNKKIKLIVPMKNNFEDALKVGEAIGAFKNSIDSAELLDYWSVTTNIELYEPNLPYVEVGN